MLLSGGMSVDPDDVTRHGIRLVGATEMHYGAAVLPGAMFLVAYLGEVLLLGVPACALHHRSTALDLVLPRILAGEHIGKTELAFLGHGGLAPGPDLVKLMCQEVSQWSSMAVWLQDTSIPASAPHRFHSREEFKKCCLWAGDRKNGNGVRKNPGVDFKIQRTSVLGLPLSSFNLTGISFALIDSRS